MLSLQSFVNVGPCRSPGIREKEKILRSCTAAAAATVVLELTFPSIVFAQDGALRHGGVVALFDPDDFVSLNARCGGQF